MADPHFTPCIRWRLIALVMMAAVLSLSCTLPILGGKPAVTPALLAPQETPTAAPEILPPALIESDPPAGSIIAVDSPITLRFNQAMNRVSVEAAFQVSGASGRFEWQDDATVTFRPDAPLLPDTPLNINVSVTAQSLQGMPLYKPAGLQYRTAGYLVLTQMLPKDGQREVDPASAIVAAFNHPVVPLGADAASLPPAFSLDPSASGRGEWINTSTYIFYPDPPLAGGVEYRVQMNRDLKSTAGTPLQNPEIPWSFQAALPKVVQIEPASSTALGLDAPIQVLFNQRMDPASVEENFTLAAKNGEPVEGAFEWNDTLTTLTFTPAQLLQRGTLYEMRLGAEARSAGGTPLGQIYQTSWTTIGRFALFDSAPRPGGTIANWDHLRLFFSSPLPEVGFESFFSLEPAVENLRFHYDSSTQTLIVSGDFEPSTSYTLAVNPALQDRYGQMLGVQAVLPFRTEPLPPRLENPTYQEVLFLTTEDVGIEVQITNLNRVPLSLDFLSPSDLLSLTGAGGYELRQNYRSNNRLSWVAAFDPPPDRATRLRLPLNPQGEPLPPGIYLLHIELPWEITGTREIILIVSDVHLTYKISASDVLVWAVQMRTRQPLVSAPILVYDENGQILASGVTDAQGIFRSALETPYPPFQSSTVMIGQPGEALFSAAISTWSLGVEAYNFGVPEDYRLPGLKTYLYTDRPIYRPGQTVYFRGIARYLNNGRYSMPNDLSTLPFVIYDSEGTELARYDLPLSAFGAAHGAYTLIPDARPGVYRLESGEDSIFFQVAEYRKPEINLQIALNQTQARAGESLSATVNARYFFDAPAGNISLNWVLYEAPEAFEIPGYQTGLSDEGWLFESPYGFFYDLGAPLAQGSAQTAPDGSAVIDLPNPPLAESPWRGTRRLTLEVTATDESGLPVSARAAIRVHPAEYYIGIRPDVWAGQAGQEVGYTVQVVDWENNPAGSRPLKAVFRKVVYQPVEPPPDRTYEFPTYKPVYTEISSANFATAPDGMARLAFTAPQPGTYQLEVSGDGARTQVLLWFGGAGQVIWPNLPNQRLRLILDRAGYQPGETAQLFIPNPFPEAASALVTVERGIVMRHALHRLEPGGATIPIPLGEEDAPNVYISVTLLGAAEDGRPDFRQGYVRVDVSPIRQTLQVELTRQPEQLEPRSAATIHLRVTDADGRPVQGEFSLAVVDLAALALADPNAPQIASAFYGVQPLGVRTSLALAGYSNRFTVLAGGVGGGGGGASPPVARRDFPDTAYWNAEIVTDANGEATVTLTLPDNLTTWQIDVRGVTADTRVGQAQIQAATSKPVLIRPVTPRFLVVGDHLRLAALAQNNTAQALDALASLEGRGFLLDEGQSAAQRLNLPPGGRTLVEWWGTVQDLNAAELTFSIQAGDYQDAAGPALGALPVLHYTARQAFATAGFLEGAVQQLELISLPAGALTDPGSAGELRIELAPSLAAAMLTSLEALEFYEYDCTEQVLARFLPNLLLNQALKSFNISLPEVEQRLERTLQPGLAKLIARQNADGGWGWWSGEAESSPYLTAYVLFGLSQARQAGISIPESVIQRAVEFLRTAQADPAQVSQPYELDRLAFQLFALAQAGAPDPEKAQALLTYQDQLSPWAQALLALALESSAPGSPAAAGLLATLQASAQRSATGAFWSDPTPRWQNLNSTVASTAMVIYALAKLEPASPLLPDSIRFLMNSRGAQGSWGSTFETTWAVLAATAYIQGTGELGGSFDFRATLNQAPLASGQAGGETRLTPVRAAAPVAGLFPAAPNALRIERSAGAGRLYYTALLDVAFPAEKVAPLHQGFSVARTYTDPANCTRQNCPPIQSLPAGKSAVVRLTLVLPQEAYYVVVEDFIPAGAEILDRSLKTSAQGESAAEPAEAPPLYDPQDPFGRGWGWWYFSPPLLFDDHIAWAADYLPAGTYELVYTLILLQPGEFRLLPARAFSFYFPEVQGSSAGALFTITPATSSSP